MRLYLILDEFSEGKTMRRFYELELLRDRNPSFFLTWTALHSIDQNSPLYGLTSEQLKRTTATILVSLSGIDQTVSQAIHTRHTYYADDILWNYQFKDIIHTIADSNAADTEQTGLTATRYVDFADFHEVEPAFSQKS